MTRRTQFVYQLQGILQRVAGRELRRLRRETLKEPNRTLQSLSSSSVPTLEPEVIATIWGWAEDTKSFFTPGSKTDASSPILDSVCTPILDSVCTLLIYNTTTAVQINTIHTRLLLYFLARFVDEKLQDVRDLDRVVMLVLESGWISNRPELIAPFKANLPKWLKAGKSYMGLVELMGVGEGVIIFIPQLKRSTWESHCPREGATANRIKDKLQDMGVPAAASIKRHGRTGHEVVQKLMKLLLTQSSISFVRCDPAPEHSPTEHDGEDVRWLRRTRGPSSPRPCSPSVFSGSSERAEVDSPPPRMSDCCHVFGATEFVVDPRILHSEYPQAVG